MIENLIAGAVLRFAEASVQSAPTILIGFLVAAVIRRFVGYERTRAIFGGGSLRSLAMAWFLGMLLPVCSLGSIPVAREMRKAGLSGGTVVAFALTAPLFNPISILYGLTLSNPMVIVIFSLATLLIVTAVGLSWDWFFRGTESPEPEAPSVSVGWRRIAAVTLEMVRQMAGESLPYILIGLIGSAALSLIFPHGSLQMRAESNDPLAPLFMSLVMIPAYVTPMVAMVQLASMFQHANSIGAAFAMLVFGAGANVGLVAWMIRRYGWMRIGVWFVVVVGLAYAVDKPLFPKDVQVVGHTHGFDHICCPFADGLVDNPWAQGWRKLREGVQPHELVGFALIVGLGLAGLVLRGWDATGKLERYLETIPQKKTDTPPYDLVIPDSVLIALSAMGLLAGSVFGCYLYYPPPSEALAEMKIVVVELTSAAKTRDWAVAEHYTPITKDWARKLEVGSFLRSGAINEFRAAKAEVLIDKLELLTHAMQERDLAEVDQFSSEVYVAFMRLRRAYESTPDLAAKMP